MLGHDQPTVPQGVPGEPTAWVPYAAPTAANIPTVDVAPPAKKGKGKLVGGVVAVVALLAAGGFAVTAISGGHDGGADSPEAAAEKLFDSVGQLDVLGALDSLLPGERDVTRERAQRLVTDLSKLGVLSDDADLSNVAGVEITLSDMSYDAVETNVDDITNVLVNGSIDASVDGAALPIGDLVIDRFLGGDRPDVDESDSGDFEDVMLTTVQEDGRWYVSIGYTIAEYARTGGGHPDEASFDIPDEGIALNGGDSPEGAISNLLDAAEGFDLEGILGTMDPRELGALQRYAPVSIDDYAEMFSDLQDEVAFTLGDVTYDVVRDGDTATVGITIQSFSASTPDVNVDYDAGDECLTITPTGAGEPQKVCVDDATTDPGDIAAQLEQVFPDSPELIDSVTTLIEDAQAAVADMDKVGTTVSEVDGKWYVSALGTGADAALTVLDALDRNEFETLIDDGQNLAEAFGEAIFSGPFEMPDGGFGD